MRLRICVLPGDGVGQEVTREAVRVLRKTAEVFDFAVALSEHAIGGVAIRQQGSPLPRTTLDACLESDAVLLGAVGDPEFDGLPREERPEAGLLALRRALGGFANLRPVVCHTTVAGCSPLRPEVVRGTDILFVRELLGGIYFGEPRGRSGPADGTGDAAAWNTMRYSAEEIERIARIAFEAARQRRHKVTSVDKANVLETSQLWRQVVSRVGQDYPQVTLEHLYVDACAMLLVSNPLRFDVVLTENLFGDILSDEAGVMAGSLGLLGSAAIGGSVDLYEPVHGSAPDIAGRNTANPLGAIASAAMLLRYTAKMEDAATEIENAIAATLEAGCRTVDLRQRQQPFVSTSEMGARVAQELSRADWRYPYHAV